MDATRNPGDALYSNYKFLQGWFIEPGTITFDEFAREFFMASGGYWKHLLSWWEVRERPDVMLIAFEHMKQDLTGIIRKVAEFIDIELDEDLLALAEEHASFTFMERHKDRFDDLMMRDLGERVANLPTGSDSAKIRKGIVGEHKRTQSPEVIAELDAIWQKEITPVTGHSDYASLIADLD
ncbi:MAG: sulfotransferase domain-containing protein [Gammaproteobacteria bacterium]|nr:MAG: sulfotransferase domain-containing protein [Gammaproteobacteria bacterium]